MCISEVTKFRSPTFMEIRIEMWVSCRMKGCFLPGGGGGGTSNKKWRGVRMLRVPNFVKSYTIGCANSQKIILLLVLIYKKIYCWLCYFYTQWFTLKNYWNCLHIHTDLKSKLLSRVCILAIFCNNLSAATFYPMWKNILTVVLSNVIILHCYT